MREDLIAELRELCAIEGRPLTVGERARTKIAMSEAADALEAAREDAADAARYRWLKANDNAYLLAEDVIDDQIAIDQARGKGVADA